MKQKIYSSRTAFWEGSLVKINLDGFDNISRNKKRIYSIIQYKK